MSADPTSVHGDGADNTLRAWRTGIDTYQEPVVYMRRDCAVCRSEGFTTQARVQLTTRPASWPPSMLSMAPGSDMALQACPRLPGRHCIRHRASG